MLIPLTKYLSNPNRDIDSEIINLIKCQALNIYSSNDQISDIRAPIDHNHESWFIDMTNGTIYCPAIDKYGSGKIEKHSNSWSKYLASSKLDTVLPEKCPIDSKLQRDIHLEVLDYIFEKIACYIFVKEIYVLGAFARKNLQEYKVPYVNKKWAYLYSPINILLVIDNGYRHIRQHRQVPQ